MTLEEIEWFNNNALKLEANYVKHEEPWKQSGFSGPKERWDAVRKPIADCIHTSGKLLDIGCANGYLLECIIKWKSIEGIQIEPFGLDIGSQLVYLAKKRLKNFENNMYVGNIYNWNPPMKFDFVRTELVYVPINKRKKLIEKLLHQFINPGGKLIICEYRGSKEPQDKAWCDEELSQYRFNVLEIKSGFYEGKELTRAVILE